MQDSSHQHLHSRPKATRHGWLAPVAAGSVMFTMVAGLLICPPALPERIQKQQEAMIAKATEQPTKYQKEQILGHWTFYDGILRKSENRADGTSTLNITFDFVASFLYGTKLRMETEWTLEDDVLTYTVVGGEPEASLKRLTDDYGSVATYRILKLTDTEMLLLDLDGSNDQYLWKRDS